MPWRGWVNRVGARLGRTAVNVRFAPKATKILRRREMTRESGVGVFAAHSTGRITMTIHSGHSRPAKPAASPGMVRYAPIAINFRIAAKLRDGPEAKFGDFNARQ